MENIQENNYQDLDMSYTELIQNHLKDFFGIIKEYIKFTYGVNHSLYKEISELENNEKIEYDTLKAITNIISQIKLAEILIYILEKDEKSLSTTLKVISVLGIYIPNLSIEKQFEKYINQSESTIDAHKGLNNSIISIIISIIGIGFNIENSMSYWITIFLLYFILYSLYTFIQNRIIIQKHKYFINFSNNFIDIIEEGDTKTVKKILERIKNIQNTKKNSGKEQNITIMLDYMEGDKVKILKNLVSQNACFILFTILYFIGATLYKICIII